jgi:hypothetical protein
MADVSDYGNNIFLLNTSAKFYRKIIGTSTEAASKKVTVYLKAQGLFIKDVFL